MRPHLVTCLPLTFPASKQLFLLLTDGVQKVNNPIRKMLDEVLPNHSGEEQMDILMNCTAFPFAGGDAKAVARYRKQIEECLTADPADPIGHAHHLMDMEMDKYNEDLPSCIVCGKDIPNDEARLALERSNYNMGVHMSCEGTYNRIYDYCASKYQGEVNRDKVKHVLRVSQERADLMHAVLKSAREFGYNTIVRRIESAQCMIDYLRTAKVDEELQKSIERAKDDQSPA